MRKYFLTLLTIILLSIGLVQSISAQTTLFPSEDLRGLSKVDFLVEKLPLELKHIGLTEQHLADEIELRLRSIGVFSSLDLFDGNSTLYVNINSAEIDRSNIAFSINISLKQSVLLERDNKISTRASTWQKGVIGKSSKSQAESYIKVLVSELMDKFIEDWKEVNNKSANSKSYPSKPTDKSNESQLNKKEDSPFTAVYVGGNRPPEVEVFNDSDRTLYLDLGQNKLIPYTIPSKTSKTFKLTNGPYKFKGTAPRVSPLEGEEDFKKGYKYTGRFTIVKYSVP